METKRSTSLKQMEKHVSNLRDIQSLVQDDATWDDETITETCESLHTLILQEHRVNTSFQMIRALSWSHFPKFHISNW